MAETTTVARPYARAAFEQAAAKQGGLKKWSDMLQVAAIITEHDAMRRLLANPALNATEKSDILLGICDAVGGEKIFVKQGRNFIKLLAANHRLGAISDIARIFETLRAEAEKTLHAEMRTAFPISDEQRDKIAGGLKRRLNRDVVLDVTVDESLLGGAIIRAGDLVIDGSAQGQLTKLAHALSQ